ncbi:vacuolar protein sorting-associated protein VPS28 family protein [Actinidia rufa]|uniref:Vacuolar protein sorting-associated protein VPS28 family protein n=1 Tax=Actinidia rufa TaxID=165716 RepID=A0A7J0FWP3_9ERIC|nr:vacuolar protein sorting-associated protein VPS28 family protein [Actinidia rufa]
MEVKLWNDKREREMYENFAELFAIIKATEKLEKAYIRDIISPAEYEPECQKLIAHFKTLASTLKDTVPSIERFHDTYKMDCPAALNRLITSGVPACDNFEGKTKMKEWIARLSKMGAADELTEQQARQLHFDLESSYNSFMAALPTAGA